VTNETPYSFIPFVERATANKIPVIITSQYPPELSSHTRYSPARAPIDAGAIHAGNMTLAAAVTKFRWVLANLRKEVDLPNMSYDKQKEYLIQKMVKESLVGEF
jgi:L-asparaginase/Glu-tRNA(Gln) amidotransferase subunit D